MPYSWIPADTDAKLRRASETVGVLAGEIKQYLEEGGGSELLNYTAHQAEEFKQRHSRRTVPLRFSVLTGEILYHCRSALDHTVCVLIQRDGGTPTIQSQFPILRYRPVNRDEIRRYDNQIAGIARREVRSAIENLQPYNDPGDRDRNWLAALKDFSNTDKHRNLILHVQTIESRVRSTLRVIEDGADVREERADDGRQIGDIVIVLGRPAEVLHVERRLTAQVVFAEWRGYVASVEIIAALSTLCLMTESTIRHRLAKLLGWPMWESG